MADPKADVAVKDEDKPEDAPLRRRTADSGDPHIAWTVQSKSKDGNAQAFPQPDLTPPTKFHPAELPDPEEAIRAGLIPQVMDPLLVDANHITMPPTGNYPVDHPKRDEHRVAVEDRGDGVLEDQEKFYRAAKAQQEVK